MPRSRGHSCWRTWDPDDSPYWPPPSCHLFFGPAPGTPRKAQPEQRPCANIPSTRWSRRSSKQRATPWRRWSTATGREPRRKSELAQAERHAYPARQILHLDRRLTDRDDPVTPLNGVARPSVIDAVLVGHHGHAARTALRVDEANEPQGGARDARRVRVVRADLDPSAAEGGGPTGGAAGANSAVTSAGGRFAGSTDASPNRNGLRTILTGRGLLPNRVSSRRSGSSGPGSTGG